MRFRPCIDLREGKVVQIVGSTLSESEAVTNYEATESAGYFAGLYREDRLHGGHVIQLGPGNKLAALQALGSFEGGFHVGGGITPENARFYLDAGASHVIVTSYVFGEGAFEQSRLDEMVHRVGRNRLVLDLSCRAQDDVYKVVTDRWQKFSNLEVKADTLERLSGYCSEFLVHGVDVEGKRLGIQESLVELLGQGSPIPVTYAGGVSSIEDLDRVYRLGDGRVDLTIGSALDIFGGDVPYRSVVDWHREQNGASL